MDDDSLGSNGPTDERFLDRSNSKGDTSQITPDPPPSPPCDFDFFLTDQNPSGYSFLPYDYWPEDDLTDFNDSFPTSPDESSFSSSFQVNVNQNNAHHFNSVHRCGAKAVIHFIDFDEFKKYLNSKISGRRNIRFKKEKLHCLYNIFKSHYGWKPLNKAEKRNKELVFKKLFQNSSTVISCIDNFPEVFLLPALLVE